MSETPQEPQAPPMTTPTVPPETSPVPGETTPNPNVDPNQPAQPTPATQPAPAPEQPNQPAQAPSQAPQPAQAPQPMQPSEPPSNEPNQFSKFSRFEELDEAADRGELTQEKLQSELNRYAEAIRSEFEVATRHAPDDIEEYTRDFFKKNIHSAAAQIVWLANNAQGESVRLSASKYVIEQALLDSRADGDPIKKLLNDLTKQPTKQPAPTNS